MIKTSFLVSFQLGTVSLALFRTLIGLYCEDVMLQLILRWVAHRLIPVTNPAASNWFMTWWAFTLYLLPCRLAICLPTSLPTAARWFLLTRSVPVCLPRYLIPCNHMMLSQRRVVRERDCYSVSASKILALTPSCCSPDHSPPPLRQLDSILFSKGAETPSSTSARGKRGRTLKEHFTDWISFFFFSFIVLDVTSVGFHYTVPAKVIAQIWEQEDIAVMRSDEKRNERAQMIIQVVNKPTVCKVFK